MNESDQTVTNWSKRGVSKAGAIKAQELFGVSSAQIISGQGPMPPGPVAVQAGPPTLAQALEVVALEVGGLPPLVQSAGRDALTKWAAGNASAEQTAAVLAALAQAAAKLPAMGAALAETPVPRPAKHET